MVASTIRFSIDDDVNILSHNSKTMHTKLTKPVNLGYNLAKILAECIHRIKSSLRK